MARQFKKFSVLAGSLLIAAGGLAACGSSSSSSSTASQTSNTTGAASSGTANTAGANANATKPAVEVPSSAPPSTLQVKDITVGTGAAAKAGDFVSVQYVGVAYSTKKQFDASWDRGQPFQFSLGAGNVIKGWDQGVVGMKVGGRRELTIPPSLGYGAQGSPPVIGPNETLIFVIDLVSVG